MEYYTFSYDINSDDLKMLFGVNDEYLKQLENIFGCQIIYRDGIFKTTLENYELLKKTITSLLEEIKVKKHLDSSILVKVSNAVKEKDDLSWQKKIIAYTFNGKPICPKTKAQANLLNCINKYTMTFSIGPAGTGKTFLSVAMAVNALKKGEVEKIVLTRPAVEAGESLGFLPGDLKEKVDPYLMPLYDALNTMLGEETCEKYREKGTIEVIPLAYMRGRTLDDAFILLDEAQNTTEKQLLMFLTRLGINSKMIINGDITQIDLKPGKEKSGLLTAYNRLSNIKEIAFCNFDEKDVVRHPLVEKIIKAYANE